jgi:hypothetical protein
MFFFRKKKQLRFNNILNVKIIPDRTEYLLYDLWWNSFDYFTFQRSANEDINNLIYRHPNMNYKQAIKLLYQPLVYDNSNFEFINLSYE